MNFNTPPNNPVESAQKWFDQSVDQAATPNPLAMVLSTVNGKGIPSSRVVLQKGFDESGIVFFTNYKSDKANDIVANESVSLLFHWDDTQRQIRIQGSATKLSSEESEAYFATRPRESQIGAWASEQSMPLDDRSELLAKADALSQQWKDCEVPRPEHWGGYRVSLNMIEFWEGQDGRLHDRIRYTNNNGWSWQLLQP
jgi:pyridoxamine 5'-phosphate oxidase